MPVVPTIPPPTAAPVSYTHLDVYKRQVKHFEVGGFGIAVGALPFASQPETVRVATDPTQPLPRQTGPGVRVECFEFVEQEERMEGLPVVVSGEIWKGSGAFGIGQGGNLSLIHI